MKLTDRLLWALEAAGDHPDAIQQLRKLVLCLAVAGKLKPEAGEAIPTSDLRECLAARNAALCASGVLKTLPTATTVRGDELPAGLTDTERFVRLGMIASVRKGLTGIKSAVAGPYPLVITAEQPATCDHFDFDGAAAIVPLVSSTGHGNASIHRLHYREGKFALGSILAAVLPYAPDLVSARFLFEYLTAFKEELLVARMLGTANVTLTLDKIAAVPVPLVSPHAQQKVDELMAFCDEMEKVRTRRERIRDQLTVSRVATITSASNEAQSMRQAAAVALENLPELTARPDQVEHFRNVILELAVRGLLVRQDTNDEPASVLLDRIALERVQLAKDGKAKPKDALPDLDVRQAPFDLPAGWAWARFPELGKFGRGKSKHRPRGDPALFRDGTHPMIQTGDVARSRGVIKTHRDKYNDVGLAQSWKWPAGTLCITIAANIADSGILSFAACFPDSVVGFVPASPFENARYFEYFVRTAKANLAKFAPATAQKNISLEILNAVWIPVPPLREQREIVAKVDELMALCDRLEESLAACDESRVRFLQALLVEALASDDDKPATTQ